MNYLIQYLEDDPEHAVIDETFETLTGALYRARELWPNLTDKQLENFIVEI